MRGLRCPQLGADRGHTVKPVIVIPQIGPVSPSMLPIMLRATLNWTEFTLWRAVEQGNLRFPVRELGELPRN